MRFQNQDASRQAADLYGGEGGVSGTEKRVTDRRADGRAGVTTPMSTL